MDSSVISVAALLCDALFRHHFVHSVGNLGASAVGEREYQMSDIVIQS